MIMTQLKNIFSTRWGIIGGRGLIAYLRRFLQNGKPGNMGICVACFNRDIAGVLAFTGLMLCSI
jgi:hypothetical protein